MGDIFGYTFEEIQEAQQGGRLGRTVDTSKVEPFDPVRERSDLNLLNGFGEAKLREMGYLGVIDRLERGGYLGVIDRLERGGYLKAHAATHQKQGEQNGIS